MGSQRVAVVGTIPEVGDLFRSRDSFTCQHFKVFLPALMSADGNCIFLFFLFFGGGRKAAAAGNLKGSRIQVLCVYVCARARACVRVPVRATRQAESEKKWGRGGVTKRQQGNDEKDRGSSRISQPRPRQIRSQTLISCQHMGGRMRGYIFPASRGGV